MSFEKDHKVEVHYSGYYDSVRKSQFYEVNFAQNPVTLDLIEFDEYGLEAERMPYIMKFISDDELLLAYGDDNQRPSDFNSAKLLTFEHVSKPEAAGTPLKKSLMDSPLIQHRLDAFRQYVRKQFVEQDFSVYDKDTNKKLYLGMWRTEVEEVLGKPLDQYGGSQRAVYEDLSIEYRFGKAVSYSWNSDRYQTSRGTSSNESLKTVLFKYGNGVSVFTPEKGLEDMEEVRKNYIDYQKEMNDSDGKGSLTFTYVRKNNKYVNLDEMIAHIYSREELEDFMDTYQKDIFSLQFDFYEDEVFITVSSGLDSGSPVWQKLEQKI
jgi:hypothetical protein